MGHGPTLPALAMAVAIVGDRISTDHAQWRGALRRHPVLMLPPVIAVVCTAIVLVLMSVATLNVALHAKPPLGRFPRSASVPGSRRGRGSRAPVWLRGHHRRGRASRVRARSAHAIAEFVSARLRLDALGRVLVPVAAAVAGPDQGLAVAVAISVAVAVPRVARAIKLGPLGLCVTT